MIQARSIRDRHINGSASAQRTGDAVVLGYNLDDTPRRIYIVCVAQNFDSNVQSGSTPS